MVPILRVARRKQNTAIAAIGLNTTSNGFGVKEDGFGFRPAEPRRGQHVTRNMTEEKVHCSTPIVARKPFRVEKKRDNEGSVLVPVDEVKCEFVGILVVSVLRERPAENVIRQGCILVPGEFNRSMQHHLELHRWE